jgi:nicotinate-nucleotide adenylyltransferase
MREKHVPEKTPIEKLCIGGSFNPIHHGHLLCARAAAEALGAKPVVIFPAGSPPHKPGGADLASAEDRLAMCRLAVAGIEGFEVDDRELRRAGPSYTIETARELRREGWNQVAWLIGADMLNSLPKWHEPEALLREVRFVVMARPGTEFEWEKLPEAYRVLRENVVEVPGIEMSSTEIRRRVAKGSAIDYFCPPAVCRYIRDHGLYLGK